MDNMLIYHQISGLTARLVTERYSTSFSRASRLFPSDIRKHIYSIYGFVRLADEIVDTFHSFDKAMLLERFEQDYYHALQQGISLNPVIHAFVQTVGEKQIPLELVDSFLNSMKMDLGEIKNLEDSRYKEYIYGSAEAVGLMCLKIFVNGSEEDYQRLKPYAQSLGAAFQKINFLRDISTDFQTLNRTYFPNIDFYNFTAEHKRLIEADIAKDFDHACAGIRRLPLSSRLAVFMAYKYYVNLLRKIERCKPEKLLHTRIRVSNARKVCLYGQMMVIKKFNLLNY